MEEFRRAIADGDSEGFLRVYEDAIESGDLDMVRTGLQTLRSLPQPATETLFRRLRATWPDLVRADVIPSGGATNAAELAPATALQSLLRMVVDGEREAARALTDKKARRWSAIYGGVEQVHGLLDRVPARETLPRALVCDRGEDIVVSPPGQRGAVFVFCGLSDRPTFDLPVLDALLAQYGYRGIYLRDPGRTAFVAGIGEGGRAAFGSTLRRLLGDERGEVIFLGSSMGGYGAIDWGCELGIGRIVAFSTPTCSNPEVLARIGEERCGMFQRMLIARGIELDLPRLLAASDPAGRIHMYYGDAMKSDRAHAMLLEHPAVTRHPVAGYSLHHSMLPVVWSGGFGAVLGQPEAGRG